MSNIDFGLQCLGAYCFGFIFLLAIVRGGTMRKK